MRSPLLCCLLLLTAHSPAAAHQPDLPTDGSSDVTAAIQQAIDQHGSLHFPKGTYRLSQTITIDLAKTGFAALSSDGTARFIMEAPGPAFHLIGHHDGSAAPHTFKPETWDRERSPMISGIEILASHPQANGIQATGTMQLTIHRVVIRKCQHAIHLTTRNRNVIISDCHLYENSGIGVFYDNVNLHQSNIIGSHISYNRGGGIVSRGGNVRNLHIGTCDIESNHHPEAPPSANVELNSTGGSIGEVAITGCTIQHSSKAEGSANIRILGAGNDPSLERRGGRPHTREGNVTISANVFSDVKINIEVRESRGVVITGNTFWEGFEHDILAENCEKLIISHNNMDRNPRYLVNGFDNAERNGLLLRNCEDSHLIGNIISGVWRKRAAVDIIGGRRLMIAHNSILDSDGTALRLENVHHSLISDNLLQDDRPQKPDRPAPLLDLQNCTHLSGNQAQ
jgi:hypothetical protein